MSQSVFFGKIILPDRDCLIVSPLLILSLFSFLWSPSKTHVQPHTWAKRWRMNVAKEWTAGLNWTCRTQTLTLINKSSRFLWQRFSEQDLRPRRVLEEGSRIICHLSPLQFHPHKNRKNLVDTGWMVFPVFPIDVFHLFCAFPRMFINLEVLSRGREGGWLFSTFNYFCFSFMISALHNNDTSCKVLFVL